MQGPGIQDLEVATLSDLQDIHVATLTDNSTVFVQSENSQYRLYKNGGGFVADGSDIVAPRVGSPIAGAATAAWVRIGPAVVTSAPVIITGAIGTENILDSTTTPNVVIPPDSSETYRITLTIRRAADAATLYYERLVTVSRDGTAAPVITQTALVTNEDPAWPAANAAFDPTTATLVSGQYYLNVEFTQSIAPTTPSTAVATVTRGPLLSN